MKIAHPILAGICAAGLVGAGGVASASPPRVTVGCNENAQVAERITPDPDGYRVIFGLAALPKQTVPHEQIETNGEPLRYWTKMGLLVRLGRGPVDVVVPPAWRDRVLIGWGYPNLHPPSASLRILRCPLPEQGEPYSDWRAYPGGVYFDERACVPLIVRAGGRTATIRLSLGRRCS